MSLVTKYSKIRHKTNEQVKHFKYLGIVITEDGY